MFNLNNTDTDMMKSDELKKQADCEDNDLAALGIYNKVIREKRTERFEKYRGKFVDAGYTLTENESQGRITIEPTGFGIVDYYPKANRILIRKKNKWHDAGLRWLVTNLLKDEH